jgi:hypothetical protein
MSTLLMESIKRSEARIEAKIDVALELKKDRERDTKLIFTNHSRERLKERYGKKVNKIKSISDALDHGAVLDYNKTGDLTVITFRPNHFKQRLTRALHGYRTKQDGCRDSGWRPHRPTTPKKSRRRTGKVHSKPKEGIALAYAQEQEEKRKRKKERKEKRRKNTKIRNQRENKTKRLTTELKQKIAKENEKRKIDKRNNKEVVLKIERLLKQKRIIEGILHPGCPVDIVAPKRHGNLLPLGWD